MVVDLEPIDMTMEELDKGLLRWANRGLIQETLPKLPAEVREFMLSGILPDEWDAMFSEEEV